jgi:hypothetical protein
VIGLFDNSLTVIGAREPLQRSILAWGHALVISKKMGMLWSLNARILVVFVRFSVETETNPRRIPNHGKNDRPNPRRIPNQIHKKPILRKSKKTSTVVLRF